MTNNSVQPSDVHPASLLLPWYLSGQLSEPERREVERHLTGCPSCSEELESLSALRVQTRDMFVRDAGPSPGVKRAVMSEVRDRAVRPRLIDRIVRATLGLSWPVWVRGFAMLLIVGQFGALAWLISGPGASPELTSRSVLADAVRLRIAFNPAAAERDVQGAIRDLGGRVVDGPTADGAYIVELSGGSPQEVSVKLRALRERPGLVERIEGAAP